MVTAHSLAISSPISKVTKAEITEMIKARFSRLSVEEIEFALKMDRFGLYGEPTPHFQALTVDYVAKVLNRFQNWLNDTRFQNNIPLPRKKEEAKEELSEAEKEQLILNGCLAAFEEYKETGTVSYGRIYVYEVLYSRGLLPKHTPEFKEDIQKRAERAAKEKAKLDKVAARGDKVKRAKAQTVLDQIDAGEYGKKLRTECRKLILKDFFRDLALKGKELKPILCKDATT